MRACPACQAVYSTDAEFCGLDGERLFETAGDPLAGKIIGRYRMEELIGTGASGLVYRATTLDAGAEVAVKLLYGEMACDRRVVQRFRREADTAIRMRHRNIVHVVDFEVEQSGLAYLVMELLDGVTLDTAIQRDAPFAPERAARIVEQIAAGLAEAHRQGYVHRDLKPGNVMLIRDAGDEQVKILDFGIVGTMRTERGEARLTKTGYVVGTPAYMAPEQIDESSELGPAADVYALGAILYEMLAGAPPFTGNVEQILVKKLTRDPEPLEEHGEIGRLAMSLLRRDPRERPPTALHVSAQIHRLSLLTEDPKTVLAQTPFSDVVNAPTLPLGALMKDTPPLRAPSVPPLNVEPTLDPLGNAANAVTIAEHTTDPRPADLAATTSPDEEAPPDLPIFSLGAAQMPSFTIVSFPGTDVPLKTGDHTDPVFKPGFQPPGNDETLSGHSRGPSTDELVRELEALGAALSAATAATRPSGSGAEGTEVAVEVMGSGPIALSDSALHPVISGEIESDIGRALAGTANAFADSTVVSGEAKTVFDATAIANLRDEAKLGSSPVPRVDPHAETLGGNTEPNASGAAWTSSRFTYAAVLALGIGMGLFAVLSFFSTQQNGEVLARQAPPAATVRPQDPPVPAPRAEPAKPVEVPTIEAIAPEDREPRSTGKSKRPRLRGKGRERPVELRMTGDGKRGRLGVTVDDGGRGGAYEITIDGKYAGLAPVDVELSPGVHVVEVAIDDELIDRKKVNIETGKSTRVVVDL